MTELHYPGAMEVAMANATRERPRKGKSMGLTSYIEQRMEAERVKAMEQRLKDLLPYVHHDPHCYKGGNDNATVIDCTCGLEKILNP